jgi:hypothetical protein
MNRTTAAGLVLAFALAGTACDALTGLDDAKTKVVMRQIDASNAQNSLFADVKSLEFEVVGVRMINTQHPIKMEYVGPSKVNAKELPTSGGIMLAKGILPAAGYTSVELEVRQARITFNREVTIGTGPAAKTFAANQSHPLAIRRDGTEGILRVRLPAMTARPGYAPTVTLNFDGAACARRLKVVDGELVLDPIITAGSL